MCSNAIAPGNIEIMSTELITTSKQTYSIDLYFKEVGLTDWLTNGVQKNTHQFGIGLGFIYFVRINQNIIKKITYLGGDSLVVMGWCWIYLCKDREGGKD